MAGSRVVAIQQVSGSIHVQLVGLLKCSGQSDNTATQGIYNKRMYNTNNTPRYMQTACNHIQVGAKYGVSPPALAPDRHDSTPCSGRPTIISLIIDLFIIIILIFKISDDKVYLDQ